MVPSLPLLSCELPVSVRENPTRERQRDRERKRETDRDRETDRQREEGRKGGSGRETERNTYARNLKFDT